MLTVKWQYRVNGHSVEHLYEAETVTAGFRECTLNIPTSVNFDLCGRNVEKSLVVLDGWDLAGRSFGCGKIYVMNEGGKTIASYDLGEGDLVQTALPPAAS